MAKLYFRYGAMNSGKSTALMQVAHNYEEQGMRVLILKPQVDSKGGGELVSRLGVRRKADLLIRPGDDVFLAVEADRAAHQTPLACVLCDESQFFTPAQAEQLFMVTVDLGIPVICYGLRSDFSLQGFPGSTRLMELAHTIDHLHLRAQGHLQRPQGGGQVRVRGRTGRHRHGERRPVCQHVPPVLFPGAAGFLRRPRPGRRPGKMTFHRRGGAFRQQIRTNFAHTFFQRRGCLLRRLSFAARRGGSAPCSARRPGRALQNR